MDKAKIKAFVQNTLGCGCPEEVFQRIECDSNIRRDGIEIRHRINIGNRLLVFIVPVESTNSLNEMLPRLVDIGKSERDISGFNRFRLVLALDDTGLGSNDAEELFQRCNKDEKIHLHIISKENILGLV